MLTIFDWWLKRLRKILRYKECKIRILCLHVFWLISMTINNCKSVIVVLCCHFSGRVRAEYAYLIVKCWCIVYKFCLVKLLIEFLHDLIADFYPDTYINSTILCFNTMIFTDSFKPAWAFSSDTWYDFIRIVSFLFVCDDPLCHTILDYDILYHSHELDFYTWSQQMFLQSCVNLISFLSSKMADRTFDQFKIGTNCFRPDPLDSFVIVNSIDLLICPKFQIYIVCFFDQFFRLLIAKDLRQSSPYIWWQR